MIRNIITLLFLCVFILSACHTQVDNISEVSALNKEKDSIMHKILSENMNASITKEEYEPNDKDVNRCVEICDTLIARKAMGSDPIITKLRILSIAKRYNEFIEFGKSEVCSSCELIPVPNVFECKLNAMQCHLKGDSEGEEKYIDLAMRHIDQYMVSNKSSFDALFKMNHEEFDSIVVKNYKLNQNYVKAMIVVQIYRVYYTYAKGSEAWSMKYEELNKKYPNAYILDCVKESIQDKTIMDF